MTTDRTATTDSTRRRPLRDLLCPKCRAILVARLGPAARTAQFDQCLRRCDTCGIGYSNSANSPSVIERSATERAAKQYTLMAADHSLYRTRTPGKFGGYWPKRIYGRLDCPNALRHLENGHYRDQRVFFADEAAAAAAGFRPCSKCLPIEHARWKALSGTPVGGAVERRVVLPTPEHPDCYWVEPGMLLAGEYPGDKAEPMARAKLRALVDIGVRTFIDLTEEGENGLRPYAPMLEDIGGEGVALSHVRLPIADVTVPTALWMHEILARIHASLAQGRPVYLHCWGGTGRTGTVVACWLVDRGLTEGDPTRMLQTLRSKTRKRARQSPDTHEQAEFARHWQPWPSGVLDAVIGPFEQSEVVVTERAFGDGGTEMLFPRLRRAALNQATDGSATVSRYGIWGMTVRDHIAAALECLEKGDAREGRRLLTLAHVSVHVRPRDSGLKSMTGVS